MFCRKCGKEIPDDSVFCPKCGAATESEASPKEELTDTPEQREQIQDKPMRCEVCFRQLTTKLEKCPNCDTPNPFYDGEKNEDSVSIISEINHKIKNNSKELKRKSRKKTLAKLMIIAAALAAVVAAALIVFIPQAGIGFEYELVDNDHYAITKYTGSGTDVTVPDTIWFKPVTIISASAFNGTNITDVKIGKNIIGIGESAFMNCSSLEELDCSAVEMADGSNFLIMDEAFSGCTALKKVTLPNSGIAISNEAFKNCSALEEIKIFGHDSPYYSAAIGIVGKNNKIGARAFEHCTSLKSLALEKVNLGRYAFSECTGLTELWIDGGSLERGEFMGCTQLKSVEIYFSSNSYYPQGISDECFAGCSALENFSGSNISSIGYNAFLNCAELSELNFDPNPTDISDRAFEGCTNLKQENSKKNKLAQEKVVNGLNKTIKEFVSEYGMPDECYNGKAIYNVENMQYCINFRGGTFDPDRTDKIFQIGVYGGKEINFYNGMHLGEDMMYYETMADKLRLIYVDRVSRGIDDFGADCYEVSIYFISTFELVIQFDTSSMKAYGAQIIDHYTKNGYQ